MDSRRVSCSFMARAASSISANMRGFTAAVWAITARVSTSTFSSALQHGQVTSKLGAFFATLRIIPQKRVARGLAVEFHGKYPEDTKQLPAEQEDRKQDDEHRHQFTECEN